ncbi:methyltransferase [Lichenicoccus sp.]|uniref:class I SAM-dependent methyltransferase n=1 Tax=Lichenicoccus sp. TaxID=2781899 RepID=UPI003D0CD129
MALQMRAQIALFEQRPADAVVHLTKALAAAPDAVVLHAGLAQAYRAAEQPVQAEAHYRRVARLQPSAVTHLNLGNILMELQRPAEAAPAYRLALRFDPGLAEAHYGSGIALVALGSNQAADAFANAVASRPDFASAHVGLVEALQAMNLYDAALQAASQALVHSDTPELRLLFIDCARDAISPQDTPELRQGLRRALEELWTRPQDLAPAICMMAAQRGSIDALEEPLSSLLSVAPVRHRDVEAALARQRREWLKAARSGAAFSPTELACACRLAQQCFINEYAWDVCAAELGEIELLQAQVQTALDRHVAPPDALLAALAMYVPLSSLIGIVAAPVSGRPAELVAVLAQQVIEPAEELRLRDTIRRATPIDDEVSRAVRAQYESNPYPRWVATLATSRQVSLGEWLPARFGISSGSFPSGRTLDVLVAGCGTGQHAVETVRALSDVSVLAIDLSLTSLAFAARMTAALGVAGIEYMQADLLEAAQIGRSFDMIGVGGVLHHLADPWAGWRALLALLRPGGVMNVLLYTVRGRTDVQLARDWIAAREYEPTASGIRACRNALMTLDADWAVRLAASPDFASSSGCRDLLFHVQERAVTLPEVARFLAEEQIELLGVEVPAATERAFKAWNGDSGDDQLRDLSRWDLFEAEHPGCFAGMLNLWVQARRPA